MELTPHEQACLDLAKEVAEIKRKLTPLKKAISILMEEREARLPTTSIQQGEIP